MNIFYLGYSLEEDAGGIERYTFTILEYLKNHGHNVIVYTASGKNKEFNNIDAINIKILNRFFLGKIVGKKLYEKFPEIDLFLCGHLYLTRHMEEIVTFYNKRYSLFVYGIECWAGRFKRLYHNLKHLQKVISISSFTTEQILEQGFVGHVIYCPPTIKESEYSLYYEERKNQTDSTIRLLTVGRISSKERYKGHDTVINAVKILIDEGFKNVEYWVVGKGDDIDRLKKITHSLDIEKYVKFFGFVEDEKLKKIYLETDIFIMPSKISLNPLKPEGEGFGIVFIEAGSYGLPIIGPDNGGPNDIIDNWINGLTCNPASVKDVAETIKILLNDKDLRIKMGNNARKKILDNFSDKQLGNYINKLLEL